jgi:hypothetical protein
MKRIAVCLSGHVRNWEVAFDNQKKFWSSCFISDLNEDIIIDYFFHTWDESTERKTRNSNFETRILKAEEIQRLIDAFNPKRYIIDSKKCNSFKYDNLQLSIFYGFYQSVKLKREYEIEHNFEYDIVIKSRFDIVFHPTLHSRCLYLLNKVPMEIMSTFRSNPPNEYCLVNFNDITFYGSSFVMDLATNLYFFRIKQFEDSNNPINYRYGYGPGVLMKLFFEEYGIQPVTVYTNPSHNKRGIFMNQFENIVRYGHSEIKDFNNPLEWDMVRKIQGDWFSN